MSNKELH